MTKQDFKGKMGRGWALGLAVAGVMATAGSARAEEPIVEKLEHGQVNWSAQTVIATGSGAPNLKLENVAQVRLAAERAAKLDAYRKILEALKGVRITATELGSAQLSKVQVKTQVQGIIQGCKTVDTRYYSDGGVDVVIQCPLNGGLATALTPVGPQKKVSTEGEAKYTGLIVDAVGMAAKPALAPRVKSGDAEVYGPEMVGPNQLRQNGAARYVGSVDDAKKDPRVGASPLVVKATGLGEGGSDIMISAEDAAKLQGVNLAFMAEGRVVIATDSP